MLTKENREKLKKALAIRESSGNQRAVNSLNYIGLYQFGAAALEDLGYLVKGAWKRLKNKAIDDSSLWTGKDSVKSKQEFLDSLEAQNKAMDALMDINYRRLVRLGIDMPNKSQQDIAGLLAASHLMGAGGARDLYNGVDKADAYGSKASEYFKLGQNAVA